MSIIPTIVRSSPRRLLSLSPTNDLRLEIGHHRRYDHAYSTHA